MVQSIRPTAILKVNGQYFSHQKCSLHREEALTHFLGYLSHPSIFGTWRPSVISMAIVPSSSKSDERFEYIANLDTKALDTPHILGKDETHLVWHIR